MIKLKNTMKCLTMIIFALIFLSDAWIASAQDRIPREFSNPDEIISFDRQTSFPEAIDILNIFAQDYSGKFIINRTGFTGPIGVSLPPMNWRDALDYILRVQGFVALESPEFFELLTQQQAEQQTRTPSADPAQPDRQPTATTTTAQDERRISTSTREVRINATFFEGSRRALREVGVDWSTLTNLTPANVGDFVGDGGGEGFPSTEFGGSFVNVNSVGAQNVSQNVFNSLVNFGNVGGIEVQALFSAFEADNLGKILATPSIKVMNGEEGRIQVGQDFSIKQRDFAGNVTDQFFSTGTILTVRPQIITEGDTTLIYLDIQAERSSAQPDPVSTVVQRQQASTHAILLDGESTVMAGLYRTEEARVRRGIPFLKDLPGWFFGLKYLFGYNSTDILEDELIVLLQAELETPIQQRLGRSNLSQRQALENKQETHRNFMDRVVERPVLEPAPAIIEEEPEEVVEEIIQEEDLQETFDTDLGEEGLTEEEIEARRAELERRQLQEAELRQQDISRFSDEWRPMDLTDLNDEEKFEFYVIGGSFQVKSNADSFYQSLIDEGLDARILLNESTGFYRVAFRGFDDIRAAINYLNEMRRTREPDTWIARNINN